jgi:hypothetical protein
LGCREPFIYSIGGLSQTIDWRPLKKTDNRSGVSFIEDAAAEVRDGCCAGYHRTGNSDGTQQSGL